MADKRRPRLRDEVSASLEGLDDLTAELSGDVDADDVEGDADADGAGASLEELDPEYSASLAEVRELAAEIAEGDDVGGGGGGDAAAEAQPLTRHLGVEAEATTLDAADAARAADDEKDPSDAEIDPDFDTARAAVVESEAWAGAVDAADDLYEADIAEPVEVTPTVAAAAESVDGAYIENTTPDADTDTDTDAPVATFVVPPADDVEVEAQDGAEADNAEAVTAGPKPEPALATDSEPGSAIGAAVIPSWQDADLTFEPLKADPDRSVGINEAVDSGASIGDNRQITAALMPEADAHADAESTGPRPWTPAAAMEPIAPFAPPPARPLTPLPDMFGQALPADGGKKMNILPVVVIAVFVILIVLLVVVVVRQT